MSTIIKGKNPRKPYTVRYWADGRQREKSFATLKGHDGAEAFRVKVDHDTRAGIFTDPKLSAVPFTDYASDWIKQRTAAATQRNYEQALRLRVAPAIGGKTLKQVANDREAAQALVSALPVSRQQVTVALLTGVCNAAVKAGRIPSHRLSGLRFETNTERAEVPHVSHKQLTELAERLNGWELTIWLMRGCGLRIGEALAVNESCVRDGGTVLRIHEQVLANGNIGPLKHRKPGDYRDIPLPAYVAAKLKGFEGFTNTSRSSYNKTWRRACRAVGLPDTFVPHMLRHTFASVALHDNIPISEVSRWLGHASIEMTHRIYGYLVPASWGRARNVLDAEYEKWSSETVEIS